MQAYVEVPLMQSTSGNRLGDRKAVASAPPQDEQLAIKRTLGGDVEAFNVLVLKYQKVAFSVAHRVLQSREPAADVVQESFVKAFIALSTFRGHSFKSWLLRIVVNGCYDNLRRDHHHYQLCYDIEERDEGTDCPFQPVDPRESAQAYIERMELNAQIELGIRNLPPEQRIVLVLCDIHGYTYEEISEITGFVIGTIKSRISRARARLRDILLSQPDLLPSGFVSEAEKVVR